MPHRNYPRPGHCAIIALLALVAISIPAGTAAQSITAYGVMPGQGLPPAQRFAMLHELGATHYRPLSVFLDREPRCDECQAAQAAGLALVLTVRAGGGPPGVPADPPADLAAYQAALDAVLARYPPAVLVVENEHNSRALFYTGSPAQYLEQLAAACAVAHGRGIPCTDGGITNAGISALVTQAYWDAGRHDEALRYARATLAPLLGRDLDTEDSLAWLLAQQAEEIARLRQFVEGYAAAGADYVNFHWYLPGDVLGETVAYLRQTAGLPVLSNEIGQRNDNPEQTASTLAAAQRAGVAIVIWYSIDTPGSGARARALWAPDGELRATGRAFLAWVHRSPESE